ncbi:LamG domain-containing protein [Candidatus Woesearchaeota archaeon]|nr:LamG domain-containing protein [Candidatus Woesearchaeota archaeon]
MQKRGQSAMEFLMTYGWAILVIIIVLAALFFLGVFEPKTNMACNVKPPFVCKDIQVDEGGVTVVIGNRNVDSISDVNIKVNNEVCSEISINDIYGNSINGIKNKITTIKCGGLSLNPDNKADVSVNFIYTSNTLEHNITADGYANIENGNEHESSGFVFGWHGDSLNDYIGSLLGTAYGGITLGDGDGILGSGTSFGNLKYIDFGAHSFDITNQLTLGVWFKSNGAPPYSVYHAPFMHNGLNFGMLVRDNNKLYSYLTNVAGTRVTVTSLGTLLDGNWHYLVMTYDGVNVKAYIDGNFINSLPQTGNVRTAGNALIGRYGSYYTNADIDEINIWNRTLSDPEISALYNSFL